MPLIQDKYRVAQCDTCQRSIQAEELFSIDGSDQVYCLGCYERRFRYRSPLENSEIQETVCPACGYS